MKKTTKMTVMALLGITMVSSNAYSGSAGGNNGDILRKTCYICNQIPQPSQLCPALDASSSFCGTEDWYHNGNQDCKRFSRIILFCSLGGTQVYTNECWSGAGYWCNEGEDPDCQK